MRFDRIMAASGCGAVAASIAITTLVAFCARPAGLIASVAQFASSAAAGDSRTRARDSIIFASVRRRESGCLRTIRAAASVAKSNGRIEHKAAASQLDGLDLSARQSQRVYLFARFARRPIGAASASLLKSARSFRFRPRELDSLGEFRERTLCAV